MKPILQIVQKTIVENIQKEILFQRISIIPEDFDSLNNTSIKMTTSHPLKLYISMPFPLQAVTDIAQLCWEKLLLKCTLVRRHYDIEKGALLNFAEQFCYFISHRNFVHEQWEGSFILSSTTPWKWLEIDNGIALQMQFVSSNFSLIY